MSYHSHTLNSVSHTHIIGRTDPITGDTIKENDSIVFCLVCQSCFLEESWNYMNNRHCEQIQTLNFVPLPPPQLIAKKKEQKLIAELKDSMINPLPALILPFVFGFISYYIAESDKSGAVLIGTTIGLCLGVFIGWLSKTQVIKEFTGHKSTSFSIYESYMEIENVKFYWNEIEQINFKRTMLVEFDDRYGTKKASSHYPSLEIYLNNGEFLERELPTTNYPKIKPFLFGLAWASQFTSIFFYTEHEKEYGLVQSFDRNYKGTIKIGVPTQLAYNPEEN
ncbi:hypothetical protein WAF17_21510 [Bernardetia sp. ABR2-2B]|uniref:hypothetical protein n=1 Tax=Bernardetia sp. ABR2-2B TaxID=3127472 RepID=UPI0030D42ED0